MSLIKDDDIKDTNKLLESAQRTVEQYSSDINKINQNVKRISVINSSSISSPHSEKNKQQNLQNLQIQANRSINKILDVLRYHRLAIATKFHQVRAKNPGVTLDDHPELKALKAMSLQLQEIAQDLNNKSDLINTIAPRTDPLAESFPLTPKEQPVMSKDDLENFRETAKSKGWNKASDDIRLFAKNNKVSATQVKSQVVEDLMDQRFKQIFGKERRDVTKEPDPEVHTRPSKHR